MELAIIGILFALSIRSMFGEWIISGIFNIKVIWNIIAEFVLSIIFIYCMYYNSGLLLFGLYFTAVIIYILFERNNIISAIKMLKPDSN